MLPANAPLFLWIMGDTLQNKKKKLKFGVWCYLKGRILLAKRRSYCNYAEWFRTNRGWQSLLKGWLLDKKTLSRAYFNPLYIESLVDKQLAERIK
jgi:hypothetical protein